ncbi:hypothetical protein L218DRAFT_186811 [Marasmius fiardii PR-910]|nr:hypothetical protein L218DRAFT_186811 [Marasmius fiardii PR-910]
MEGQTLTDYQLEEFRKCVQNVRLGDSILFASSALFLFDYVSTIFDEIKFLRRTKWLSLGTGAFVVSRYCAMVVVILAIIPARHNLKVDSINKVVRLAAIIASEFILATRTWAIWRRSRKILWTLIVFSVFALIPIAIIMGENVATNTVRPLIIPELAELCSTTFGNIPNAFIVAYVVAIIYEMVTLSLSLFRIAQWRKSIPENMRVPLLDTLWRDGVLYFTFMLLLSFMNIGIILQSDVPQLRTAGANLQAVLHSAIATRIVLVRHLWLCPHFPFSPNSSFLSKSTWETRPILELSPTLRFRAIRIASRIFGLRLIFPWTTMWTGFRFRGEKKDSVLLESTREGY